MEGIVHVDFHRERLSAGVDIVTLLTETQIFPSKGEARKMILNGGVSINRQKIAEIAETISENNLLHSKYLLIQKGKKNYFLVKAV